MKEIERILESTDKEEVLYYYEYLEVLDEFFRNKPNTPFTLQTDMELVKEHLDKLGKN